MKDFEYHAVAIGAITKLNHSREADRNIVQGLF